MAKGDKEKIDDLMASVKVVLQGISKKNDLDHFELLIKNHDGALHVESTAKARIQSY